MIVTHVGKGRVPPRLPPSDALRFVPEVRALVEALRSVEWVQGEDAHSSDMDFCPWCGNWKPSGHAGDCQRQAVLAAFKVPE